MATDPDPDPVERNRYAPPGSDVADAPASGRSPMARPRTVTVAVLFMVASLVVSLLVDTPVQVRAVRAGEQPVFTLVILVVFDVFAAWLIARVHAGRNWARIVSLALLAIGLAVAWAEPSLAGDTAIQVVAAVVTTVLDAVGMVLLFTRPGSAWFRSS